MDEQECAASDVLPDLVAQYARGGWTTIDDLAVPVKERDGIRNMLDERVKPPFACMKNRFRCCFDDQYIFHTPAIQNKLETKQLLLYTKRCRYWQCDVHCHVRS